MVIKCTSCGYKLEFDSNFSEYEDNGKMKIIIYYPSGFNPIIPMKAFSIPTSAYYSCENCYKMLQNAYKFVASIRAQIDADFGNRY
jgi:hypothetical protein